MSEERTGERGSETVHRFLLNFVFVFKDDHCQHSRLVGDSGTVLRREVVKSGKEKPGDQGGSDHGDQGGGGQDDVEEVVDGGTMRRGRAVKSKPLARRHSRASSLDRREIYQKYIHTDRSEHFKFHFFSIMISCKKCASKCIVLQQRNLKLIGLLSQCN